MSSVSKKVFNDSTESNSGLVWKKMNSSVLGVKTIIKEYTNKQGRTHLAHFTIHGKYMGPCSKLGTEPIEYEGYFQVSP